MQPKPIAASILCLMFATFAGCGKANRIEPVSGILDAFGSHQIVALGEGLHGNTQSHAFRLALIRDPRFAAGVNDIVVEFGSARHQAVMDRFIRGEDVPHAELRKAWQDTTAPNPLWDSPIYEEFFRAVREVNRSLSPDRQLRVLLGDPPIDWATVRTHGDVARWPPLRDTHAADLVAREVLSQNRRALVIYGDGHFRRHSRWIGAPPNPTLLNLIERQGTRAFAVWTNTTVEVERMQRNIASWPVPSLTLLRGTKLGALNVKYFTGMETDPPSTMEENWDAILYLGPVSSITFSEVSAALCTDAGYTKMRLARLALGPGGPAGEDAARFKAHCGL